MGALTIAFDTTIVGALALPWVLLVIHLFFFEGESRLEGALNWVKDQGQPAVAGVLLFALTYTLGSVVSRTAQDFFDDDDLHVLVSGRLFRVGVTEGRILTRVYCDGSKSGLLVAGKENPVLANTVNSFKAFPDRGTLCQQTLSWSVGPKTNWQDDKLNQAAEDLAGLQENALMEKGGDYTVRLRQLHDQIMVLRGAAFDGFIGFSLCLFAWAAKVRGAKFRSAQLSGAALKEAKSGRDRYGSWRGWAVMLMPVPGLYLAVALIATVHHFGERAPSDAPYMEFTLMLLSAMGAWLVWKPSALQARSDAQARHAQPVDDRATQAQVDPVPAQKAETKCPWRIEHWARLVAFSAMLTTAAFLGWWSTEMLYGEQVICSYDSQVSQAQGTSVLQ